MYANVAVPVESRVEVPKAVPLALNVMVPVGAGPFSLTSAVNVIGTPGIAGFGDREDNTTDETACEFASGANNPLRKTLRITNILGGRERPRILI